MKNIHVLPTDKPSIPSRLFYKEQELVFSKKYSVFNGVNIYITSDEEIKYCWVLNIYTNEVYFVKGFYGIQPIIKKIILTTDQELITDGVQAIDDEFLEWFVKNPSCEFVEIESILKAFDEQNREIDFAIEKTDYTKNLYQIIIPKE